MLQRFVIKWSIELELTLVIKMITVVVSIVFRYLSTRATNKNIETEKTVCISFMIAPYCLDTESITRRRRVTYLMFHLLT